MVIKIMPKSTCGECRGGGTVSQGSVPYGDTSVSLPDVYCDCVQEQIIEHDGSEIILTYAQEVLERWEEEIQEVYDGMDN